jgi:hypothetical protein
VHSRYIEQCFDMLSETALQVLQNTTVMVQCVQVSVNAPVNCWTTDGAFPVCVITYTVTGPSFRGSLLGCNTVRYNPEDRTVHSYRIPPEDRG